MENKVSVSTQEEAQRDRQKRALREAEAGGGSSPLHVGSDITKK